MQKHLRETLKALKARGVKDLTVSQNGHYKIAFRTVTGHKRSMTVACSPSDRRTAHNDRAVMRRLLGQ